MEVSGNTADELYTELWWRMKVSGVEQTSRNGPVITIPEPVLFTLYAPRKRVLFNRKRDCNPFFHIAEVVWMFSGRSESSFLEIFNKRYSEYADEETGRVWGAYGYRWLTHWDFNQIAEVVYRLQKNPLDRQCVIGMWDPISDLPSAVNHNDRPCNTQIMFRAHQGQLNMLVTNRSNDLVWGAMGANVVHFTYLQELIAASTGLAVGKYQVVTNNLHVYPDMPRYSEIRDGGLDGHEPPEYSTRHILVDGEHYIDLLDDCRRIVDSYLEEGNLSKLKTFETSWVETVAMPMMMAYVRKDERDKWVGGIADQGWRMACASWMARRKP